MLLLSGIALGSGLAVELDYANTAQTDRPYTNALLVPAWDLTLPKSYSDQIFPIDSYSFNSNYGKVFRNKVGAL